MSSRARSHKRRRAAVPAGRASAVSAPVEEPSHAPDAVAAMPTAGRRRLAHARDLAEHRPTLGAALLLGLLVLAYLWSALIGGELLSPVALMYRAPPWTHLAPSDLSSYLNPLLVDVPMSHYPWNAFARSALRDGTLPLWSQHAFAGVPFLANPQTVVFSPFSFPIWLLPLNYGLGVSAAVKLWAAGFGTFLLVRELRLGFLPGLLAGIGYALCSFQVVWLTHETLPAVAALLPWMLWLAERSLHHRSPGALIGLAAATGFALTGGHPGTQVHVLAATAVFAAIRCMTVRDLAGRERAQRVGMVAGALVAGCLLAAVVFLPELLSSRGTLGTEARKGPAAAATNPALAMPAKALLTTLFPDWWGRPSGFDVTASRAPQMLVNYNERTFYAGIVVLLLAFVGALSPGAWRRKGPFLALAVLALAITVRAPGIHQLLEHLPVFSVIQNQRLSFVFELGAAVLAAFGLQSLIERPREITWQFAIPVVALVVALGALVAIGPSGAAIGKTGRHFWTGTSFDDADVVTLTSIAWLMLFALAVLAAFFASRRWPGRRYAIAAALVLVAALDMLHFANGYQPIAPASKSVPPRTPAIDYLAARADEGRVIGVGDTLPNGWTLLYGLRDVRGYDPPQPSLRYYDLWRRAVPQQIGWAPFRIDSLTPLTIQVFSTLGARYVIARPQVAELPRDTREFRWLRRVYAGDDATIFQNSAAPPRVLLPSRVVVTGDGEETVDALVSDQFDPAHDVVVERDAVGAQALADAPPARGSVRVSHETNATVTLDADLDRRGLVVLNDNFAKGWTVRVDGGEQPGVLVNGVMRGVIVDAGRHDITWSYSPPGLKLGAAISLITLAGLLAAAGALVARRRRRLPPESPVT
jgi:Bacterial membrane protein YfhO